ncbi:uncharacterized protein LOC129612848 [Condylostylus longicornis]|uniref:uncharacterized protein LOC129612848 n=1 Tax=Condylostylus longicornis TaxID=2530218 RepID=UPI00244DBA19|nr:uncharacterized protein LOC129612848 [Condylostylus longicornis]
MAEIDTSKRKPRRTAGTPSYYYRNRFAAAVIVSGIALAGLLYLLPPVRKANEKLRKYCMEPDIEFEERRQLMGFLPPRRGEDILKILKESQDLDKDR